MSRIMSVLFCLMVVQVLSAQALRSPLQYVNPFIGTGGHGHTYPGATAPFGLVQLSPDTRINMLDWDGCSGYHYTDSILYGFSHTHLSGTGVADYCDILFMPFVGGARLEPEEYASTFQKNKEQAQAGYYQVFLDKSRINCELTATERVGVHRYTFPPNRTKGSILVDLRHRDEVLESQMEIVSSREIAGYRISKAWAKEQKVYFVARFSRPFSSSIVLDMAKNPREAAPKVNSTSIVGIFDFGNSGPVVASVGISFSSMEEAAKNLENECPHYDFDKIKAETQEKWQRQLSKIEVEGGSEAEKTNFYTALYHTMIVPNEKMAPGNGGSGSYTVFSLWDTYRACNPLYTILEPTRTKGFIQTFLDHYKAFGRLPVWELANNETDCMIGNHAIPVIADAYLKGIRDFDADLALEAMIKSANTDLFGLKWYKELGYIPADKESESVSKTLEYAYDDWCIAQMAERMGKNDIAAQYRRRAMNFLNIYDPETGFFRAKSNASWQKPFNPYEVNFHFTEANAWQYAFSAPQGLDALRYLGAWDLSARLDAIFSAKTETSGRNQADITGLIGQYVHGNEPSHHIAYLYNYCGRPDETARLIRQIMSEMYQDKPDGLCGNEDCGQMSAWYVLSALGFYPVTPGSPVYTLGTPLFTRATIHLENGKDFIITAPNNSQSALYVKEAQLQGKALAQREITHSDLAQGGTLHFVMSEKANPARPGTNISPAAWPLTPMPFVQKGERVFRGEQVITLASLRPNATIYCTTPNGASLADSPYKGPIKIKESTQLIFQAVADGQASAVETAYFFKIPDGRRVERYNCTYSTQYTGGGDDALINGLRGSAADFRTGDWQGFEGQHFDVVIDLGKAQDIKQVSTGFLQDENAWIFFPTQVQVEISLDGKNFMSLGTAARPDKTPQDKGIWQQDFAVSFAKTKARYVRVTGNSMLKCPEGHKGQGYACWLFADEIRVE